MNTLIKLLTTPGLWTAVSTLLVVLQTVFPHADGLASAGHNIAAHASAGDAMGAAAAAGSAVLALGLHAVNAHKESNAKAQTGAAPNE